MFKFNIGDRVTLKECRAEADKMNAENTQKAYATFAAPLLIVRERFLQECYGGVQIYYDCRVIHPPSKTIGDTTVAFAAQQVNGLYRLTEPELEPFDVAQGAAK